MKYEVEFHARGLRKLGTGAIYITVDAPDADSARDKAREYLDSWLTCESVEPLPAPAESRGAKEE